MLRARLHARGWPVPALLSLKKLPFSERPAIVLKVAAKSGNRNRKMPIAFKTLYNRNDVELLPAGKIIRQFWSLLPESFRKIHPKPIVSNRLRPALLRSVLRQSLRETRYLKFLETADKKRSSAAFMKI